MTTPKFNQKVWKDNAERKNHVDAYNKNHNPLTGILIKVTDVFTTVVKMPVRQRVFEQVARRIMKRG